MFNLINKYTNTFKGLSREVWWLALITLVNRTGAMVIPFLSLYLTEDKSFTVPQVGWVMTSFGLGSFFGAWLGGKLSDKIGYYKVILGSLFATGLAFVLTQYVDTFAGMCVTFFLLIAVADAARPAFFVALSAYSKPENKTRSLTLIRLAINLGFSAGPALGGLIIATIGYYGLFWIDGLTCILAGLLMMQTLNPKKARISDEEKVVENPIAPEKDFPYLLFLVAFSLFGIIFVQYFSAMPLYYRQAYELSERTIGFLLAFNGALIVIIEMPLIAYIEKTTMSNLQHVVTGLVLTAVSFLVLVITPWAGILIIGMIFMSVGEMIGLPMGNAFALERSKKGRQGAYMGLFTMSFSVAHIFGHNSGMQLIDLLGFENTWLIMGGVGAIATFLVLIVIRIIKRQQLNETVSLSKI
ncbi:MFS transporter [Spongiivirga citrea]|uniref:MFS transporter n=1 Tax=Spongiivirga citrea TaxID=1481457 RepID=A0A6M0CKU1_9FLAO|nr:MFS transporter [Spongiivirga citrea]NER18576.1 MFS transporter [Spongiivirga citrea]